MKRLTLHIGVPKTGSTTLQATLLENWDVLRRYSCDYISAPQSAGIGRHNLAWEYTGDARFKPTDGTWEEARRHIDGSSSPHFLYSSEVLSRLSPEAIRQTRSITAGLGVRVVMFVRNHIDLLESWWATRPWRDLEAWLEVSLERPSLNFYATYVPWAETFGEENVAVIPYETTNDVVEAFFRAAGMDEVLPELQPVAKRSKVSLHPHFSLILEEIGRVLGADADEDDLRRLREFLTDEAMREGMLRPPRGSVLGPRAAEILDRFSDDVRQLHERVVRLPDVYFVPPEVPALPELPDGALREEAIRLLGKLVLRRERKGLLARARARVAAVQRKPRSGQRDVTESGTATP